MKRTNIVIDGSDKDFSRIFRVNLTIKYCVTSQVGPPLLISKERH